MPFSHVLYNRYSDNIAPSATVTVQTGTAATGYPPSYINDRNASRPSKLNETTGAWLFDFGSAKTVAIFALFHANFQAGLQFHLQANSADSWGAPPFDTIITMPAWNAARFPGQPWVDLRTLPGYNAYQYWRLAVLSANAVALAVGDVWMGGTVRSFNLQVNDKPKYNRPQIEHSTSYRRLRYPLATLIRSWSGTIPADDTSRDDLVSWILDADGRPVLFIPEHSAAVPEAWMALHQTGAIEVTQAFLNANFMPLDIEEDGRGLEPTPTPLT